MRKSIKHRFTYIFIVFSSLLFSKEIFKIIGKKTIPKTVKKYNFKASSFTGTFANGILLLDKSKKIIIEISDQNKIKFSGGLISNQLLIEHMMMITTRYIKL